MTFDDFLPFVAPQVLACPRDTMLHHIQQACIEFCRRSHVWREDLPTLLADGISTIYTPALDDQVEIAKLLFATVQDVSTTPKCEARIVESIEGREALRDGWTELVAWTDNRKTVSFAPAPRLDARLDLYVALKPALTAFSFPDDIFAHHAEDIAEGALWRLKRMTGRDVSWGDANAAMDHKAEFERRISTAAAQASRGFARRRRHPSERFF